MRQNILIFISVLALQCTYGQISMKDCKNVTDRTLKAIESRNIESAQKSFYKNNSDVESQIDLAIKEIQSLKQKTSLKVVDAKSKDYYVNRCVYMADSGEIFLSINFYYKKDSKEASIDKIEVQDKSHFISLSELNRRKHSKGSIPPPSNNKGLN